MDLGGQPNDITVMDGRRLILDGAPIGLVAASSLLSANLDGETSVVMSPTYRLSLFGKIYNSNNRVIF